MKVHNQIQSIVIFSIFLFFMGCNNETHNQWVELDLLEYGVPLTIKAPDSVDIKKTNFVVQNDITIKDGENYFIQLYDSEQSTNVKKDIIDDQLEMLKKNPYFERVVSKDEDGFIYETKFDSTRINYGFRYVTLKGDREFLFQTGLIGKFTLENVEEMYKAVQQ